MRVTISALYGRRRGGLTRVAKSRSTRRNHSPLRLEVGADELTVGRDVREELLAAWAARLPRFRRWERSGGDLQLPDASRAVRCGLLRAIERAGVPPFDLAKPARAPSVASSNRSWRRDARRSGERRVSAIIEAWSCSTRDERLERAGTYSRSERSLSAGSNRQKRRRRRRARSTSPSIASFRSQRRGGEPTPLLDFSTGSFFS